MLKLIYLVLKKSLQNNKKASIQSKSWSLLQKYGNNISKGDIGNKNESYSWIDNMSSIKDDNENPNLVDLFAQNIPSDTFFNRGLKIKSLSWSNKAWILLSEEGTLLSWGQDLDRTGILGQGEEFDLKTPQVIKALADLKIKTFSLWDTHAWATESSGKLFTWGQNHCGQLGLEGVEQVNKPTLVEIHKAAEVKEAKVSK